MLKTLLRRFLKACGEVVDSGEQPEGAENAVFCFPHFAQLFSSFFHELSTGRMWTTSRGVLLRWNRLPGVRRDPCEKSMVCSFAAVITIAKSAYFSLSWDRCRCPSCCPGLHPSFRLTLAASFKVLGVVLCSKEDKRWALPSFSIASCTSRRDFLPKASSIPEEAGFS